MSKRIVFLPTSIGSSVFNLSNSLKKLGIRADSLIFRKKGNFNKYSSNNYDYVIEFRNILDGLIKIINFYIVSIFKYDIFFFNGGMSLFYSDKFKYINHLDLIFLKLIGKDVVVLYQGTSGRIASYGRFFHEISHYKLPHFLGASKLDNLKFYRFKVVNLVAKKIYAYNPDLINNLPIKSEFLAYTPFIEIRKSPVLLGKDKVVIAHAPTNRNVKGTDVILEVISKLASMKYKFEFKLIENTPYSEMDQLLSNVDILIDQLFVGWYGGVAVEAMAKSTLVMCYIRPEDLKYIPSEMSTEIPIINVNSETLLTSLVHIIENPNLMVKIKEDSLKYVNKWHSSDKVAYNLARDLGLIES